jgi:lia operon protein LiaG
MIARALLLASGVALLTTPLAAQASRHVLKGDSVAIYNLVGELRVEGGGGADVVVEIQRGGDDAAKLDVQSGPLRGRETLRVIYPDDVIVMPDWGRGWNTTMHVRDDGTFGDEDWWEGKHHSHADGREVRITGRSRSGLEAFADLHVTVPKGKTVGLYLGVGKAFVTNVDGTIRVWVASADVAADRARGTLRIQTGSGNVDLRTASGDVGLATGSGDITAAGVDGSRLRLETGSGTVKLRDGKAADIHVETGSGDIDVTATSGDELSFETGSGDVDLGGLTLQVRRIEHDHVTGTLGDGKGRLSVETGSGNVYLQKL